VFDAAMSVMASADASHSWCYKCRWYVKTTPPPPSLPPFSPNPLSVSPSSPQHRYFSSQFVWLLAQSGACETDLVSLVNSVGVLARIYIWECSKKSSWSKGFFCVCRWCLEGSASKPNWLWASICDMGHNLGDTMHLDQCGMRLSEQR
jgi:hypothetical protein